ncbi:MAG TPA: hypothetical protein VFS74_07765 [Gemmatimonadales bacterium]|nr:hypothetical protein [Gemmatimonadales bacterium]
MMSPGEYRGVFLVLLAVGCNLGASREPPADAVQLAVRDTGCARDSVKPATGAPAEGLWGYEDPATSHRVAARIGPVESAAGAARVTRAVETLESRPGVDTIRHASDTVSLHLEFIPPFARPAAVYSVGPLVRLASYEPCGSRHQLLVRYLRQDDAGAVATDVLLQREATP